MGPHHSLISFFWKVSLLRVISHGSLLRGGRQLAGFLSCGEYLLPGEIAFMVERLGISQPSGPSDSARLCENFLSLNR
jgi:hypothetical protein